MKGLSDQQKDVLGNLPNAYLVEFRNVGGIVMPLIVELEYQDGTKEIRRIPAEIWRRNNEVVSKMFITEKPIKQIALDPRGETADAEVVNNFFPRRIEAKSVELTPGFSNPRRGGRGGDNPMRRAKKASEEKAKAAEKDEADEANGTAETTSESDGS